VSAIIVKTSGEQMARHGHSRAEKKVENGRFTPSNNSKGTKRKAKLKKDRAKPKRSP